MDMIIIAVFAVLFFVMAGVVTLVMKKSVLKIIGFALAGLAFGAMLGYLLAPVIISFW